MIKYYCASRKDGCSSRGIGKYDTETEVFDMIDYISTGIDWMYMIPEDGEIYYNEPDGNTVKKAVKKYDIVIQLYSNRYNKHNILVIRSKEWKENLKAFEDFKRAQECDKEGCEICDDCQPISKAKASC